MKKLFIIGLVQFLLFCNESPVTVDNYGKLSLDTLKNEATLRYGAEEVLRVVLKPRKDTTIGDWTYSIEDKSYLCGGCVVVLRGYRQCIDCECCNSASCDSVELHTVDRQVHTSTLKRTRDVAANGVPYDSRDKNWGVFLREMEGMAKSYLHIQCTGHTEYFEFEPIVNPTRLEDTTNTVITFDILKKSEAFLWCHFVINEAGDNSLPCKLP